MTAAELLRFVKSADRGDRPCPGIDQIERPRSAGGDEQRVQRGSETQIVEADPPGSARKVDRDRAAGLGSEKECRQTGEQGEHGTSHRFLLGGFSLLCGMLK